MWTSFIAWKKQKQEIDEKLMSVRFISVIISCDFAPGILIGPLIPVWPGNKAAYYEAVPLRASRLRVSAPTVTHMRTRVI